MLFKKIGGIYLSSGNTDGRFQIKYTKNIFVEIDINFANREKSGLNEGIILFDLTQVINILFETTEEYRVTARLDIFQRLDFYHTEIQKLYPLPPTAERRENFGPLEQVSFHH